MAKLERGYLFPAAQTAPSACLRGEINKKRAATKWIVTAPYRDFLARDFRAWKYLFEPGGGKGTGRTAAGLGGIYAVGSRGEHRDDEALQPPGTT